MDEITRGQTLQTGIPNALLADKRKAPDTYSRSNGHPLDTPEANERLRKLMNWRRQARVAQSDNRMEQAIDEDFYDGIQLDPEDLHILNERNQPALVFNVIMNTINWILGTERQARIDSRVLPRKKSGAKAAKTKTKLMKYTQDASSGEYEWSQAFEEAVKAGVGWIENGVKQGNEPLFLRSERWRNMWYDHLGLSADGTDWRFQIREKWADLDIAVGMFPDREDRLKVIAEGVNSLYPYLPDDTVITDMASEFDLESDLDSIFGGNYDGMRERVKLVEMWYRVPAQVKIMKAGGNDTPYGALDGAIFRPEEADHQYLVRGKYFTLTDARILTMRQAIWSGATLLQDILTPYNHNRFPFTPIFCYRRKRDNMPYGIIRMLRDPQSDLNKRRSKALHLLSANRIIAEKGAVSDKKEAYEEANRADGYVELVEGKMDKFKIQEEAQLATAHVALANDSEKFIHSIAGVTNDAEYQDRKDLSGVAIGKQQSQSQTAQGVCFDNLYYAHKIEGEKRLSLIEQFCDQEKEYRITGNQQDDEFVEVNKKNEKGEVENDITGQKADFIISKQDYKETIRLSMLTMLNEMVMGLSKTMPKVALDLIDLVVDLMDEIPFKDEIVARIRKINGQNPPDEDMTPDEKQKAEQAKQEQAQKEQAMAQFQQAMQSAQLAVEQAKAAGSQAKAMKDQIEAQMKKLEGFLKALEVAGTLKVAPELAKAADGIIAEAAAAPSGGNGQQPDQNKENQQVQQ